MANVTEADVRARCQWEAAEVPDTLLASAAFLPAGDAWLNKKLENAGLGDFDNLSESDQALAKAAEVAMVAAVVASRASQGTIKTGLLAVSDVNQKELIALANELRSDVRYFLGLLGVMAEGGFYFDSAGGADYSPDGIDNTNIDMATADSDAPFSLWM